MKLVFLPGASGNREFWRPVADALADLGPSTIVGWPGLGGVEARSDVTKFAHLVPLVHAELGPQVHVVAQSMGTVVALQAALVPGVRVASLTLVAPSGGLAMQSLGASDWRAHSADWHPEEAPRYFFDEHADLSARLGALQVPTLVICGTNDPLSPAAVGKKLSELIPRCELLVAQGGDHDLGSLHAPWVASKVRRFIADVLPSPG